MSSERRWAFRIRHMLEAMARIQAYCTGLDEASFSSNAMVLDAVIRNFQVIGEAARHVPQEIQATHAHIPWSAMQKMRHILVHDYEQVDPSVVWRTLNQDLPPLAGPLRQLLCEALENEQREP